MPGRSRRGFIPASDLERVAISWARAHLKYRAICDASVEARGPFIGLQDAAEAEGKAEALLIAAVENWKPQRISEEHK